MMGGLKLPATFLIFVSALALLTSLLGLSFPYSAANQCPKRVFFQVRIIHVPSSRSCVVLHEWLNVHNVAFEREIEQIPLPQNNNSWYENKTIAVYKSCCISERIITK